MKPATGLLQTPMPTRHADFERLLQAHRGILLKIAHAYAFQAADRDDLVQEMALQLWRSYPRYDTTRSFSTWMYRVALNVALTHRRKRQGQTAVEAASETLLEVEGDSDVDAEARERLQQVRRALLSLPPLDRALLLLHLEGCSHAEIGDVLGLSPGNAATRLNRIRDQLRRLTAAPSTQPGDPSWN